ncbi:hypothetical protein [Actinokineospora inagensis]|uniref:hypothetical protein n=1 Tax=Actinokineospora inagensis TaxID=103730 RepID=UPI000409DABB|nr:hypothetical protein [Actinokineospora inagensis]
MRFAVLALALLLTTSCAKSNPATIPPDFDHTVEDLISAVDNTATVTFEAKTCGSLLDTAPTESVAAWADATVSTSAQALRDTATTHGWQPQSADGWDLALIGPGGIRLGLRNGKIRAEQARCTVQQPLQLTAPMHPALTPVQWSTLDPSFAETSEAATRIATAAHVPPDPRTFSGTLTNAPNTTLITCDLGGPQGAKWYASTKTPLTDPDITATKQRALTTLPGWQVDPRPQQPDYFTATTPQATLTIALAEHHLTLTAFSPCTPAA